MTEPLQYLWPAVEAVSPVFARAAVIRWPAGAKDQLVAANLLKPQGSATRIRCPECGQTHVAKPQPRKQPDGSVRFYIPCPQHLRAEVKDRDIQQWAAKIEGLVHALAGTMALNGKPKALAGDRVWRCGRWTEQEVMRDVLFARGLRRKDALQFRRAITDARRPIVFVGTEVSDDGFWQGRTPPIIPLSEVATLVDGKLTIDTAVAIGLIRASDESEAFGDGITVDQLKLMIRQQVKAENKTELTDEIFVAAYRQHPSLREAAKFLSDQTGESISKDKVKRALDREGGVAAVLNSSDSDSVVRGVASQSRDKRGKNLIHSQIEPKQ